MYFETLYKNRTKDGLHKRKLDRESGASQRITKWLDICCECDSLMVLEFR